MYASTQSRLQDGFNPGYAEKAAEQIIGKSTAFETIHSARAEVSRVEERLYNLMSRLVGTMPSETTSGDKHPTAHGLLHELEDMGQSIHRSVFRMVEMLSAIERALP